MLPDPTAFETPLLATTMSVALDESGTACAVRQEGLGGVPGKSGADVLDDAWATAEGRVRELRAVLNEAVA